MSEKENFPPKAKFYIFGLWIFFLINPLFSPLLFLFACHHSRIHLHEKNSSLVACIHMTFTLVPHKVYFSCMDFTHKVYFSYKASTDQLRPVHDTSRPAHDWSMRLDRHVTDPCVPTEPTDPCIRDRTNRFMRPDRPTDRIEPSKPATDPCIRNRTGHAELFQKSFRVIHPHSSSMHFNHEPDVPNSFKNHFK